MPCGIEFIDKSGRHDCYIAVIVQLALDIAPNSAEIILRNRDDAIDVYDIGGLTAAHRNVSPSAINRTTAASEIIVIVTIASAHSDFDDGVSIFASIRG